MRHSESLSSVGQFFATSFAVLGRTRLEVGQALKKKPYSDRYQKLTSHPSLPVLAEMVAMQDIVV